MARLWIIGGFLTVGTFLSIVHSANGQVTDLGTRPPLSPWFNLYQRNGGPLDNYHMFVRPRVELNDTLQRQQADIQRNEAGLNSLGQEMTQSQELHAAIRPTGSGATFMNYSHYYPSAQGGHASATPAARRRSGTAPPATSGRASTATLAAGR